jgi:uncharacterized membrane protein YfcA
LLAALALLAAGLVMGWINYLAGAAGVVGLFALEQAAGLRTEVANGSLRLAAFAIGLAGFLGFRSRGQSIPGRAWLLGLAALPGAVVGTVLALRLPVWTYRTYLIVLLAALLWQQLRNAAPKPRAAPFPPWLSALLVAFVGLHMGFVQIGTGLVAILALAMFYSRNLVEVAATKTTLVLVASCASLLGFAAGDAVAWSPALALAAGAGLGSFFASRWSVDRGHGAVRVVVLVITALALLWELAQLVV